MALKKVVTSLNRTLALVALVIALALPPFSPSFGFHPDDCIPTNPPVCPG